MAEIFEKWRGISGSANNRVIQYLVIDATSDNDALNLAEVASPFEYDDLPRTDARIREVDKKAFKTREFDPTNFPGELIEEQDTTVADGMYYVDVIYSSENVAGGGTPSDGRYPVFAFEQSLETARIRQARYGTNVFNNSTIPAVPATTGFTPYEGINATKDTYEGADIRLPIGSYSYDFYPLQSQINNNYLDRVRSLVGHVNDSLFEGDNPGEILFVSATGRRRANQNDWEFNYKFEYRQNTIDETLDVAGGQPLSYSKAGHDYLWVSYIEKPRPTGTDTAPVRIPEQINVEQVYPRADLWNLLFVDLLP